jgi:molecular chaperone DnaK (HSP70)
VRTNPRASIRLEVECERIKKQMSLMAQKLSMNIECFMEDKDVKCEISRDEFEKLAVNLLARVETTSRSLVEQLAAQSISLEDIYAVEVVGGSTRISAVRNRLSEIFQKTLSTTLNIDEVCLTIMLLIIHVS